MLRLRTIEEQFGKTTKNDLNLDLLVPKPVSDFFLLGKAVQIRTSPTRYGNKITQGKQS